MDEEKIMSEIDKLYDKAKLYQHSGKQQEYVELLEQAYCLARNRFGENPKLKHWLYRLAYELGNGKLRLKKLTEAHKAFSVALGYLRELGEGFEERAVALYLRIGETLIYLQEYDEADLTLRKALRLSRFHENSRYQMAAVKLLKASSAAQKRFDEKLKYSVVLAAIRLNRFWKGEWLYEQLI
jgi:tetratricopeptide (TPR) repeat protein